MIYSSYHSKIFYLCFRSEEIAFTLLNKGLDEYSDKMITRGILQDEGDDDPTGALKYQSNLNNVDDILQYIKPLACQGDSMSSCKTTSPIDREVEDIIQYWKGKKISPRKRKIPQKVLEQKHSSNIPSTYTTSNNQLSENDKREEKRRLFVELYSKYNKKTGDFNNDSDNISQKNDQEDRGSKNMKLQPFRTGKQINIEQQKNANKVQKTLGGKVSVNSPFVCPLKRDEEKENNQQSQEEPMECEEDERLKTIDKKMIELIRNEIMDAGTLVTWEDVAGLEDAKRIIKEVIVLPMLRPDIFTGLRRPPKGILLFGPPGTGKTLIGKCIASQSKSTFFSISASSLTSKWVGDGEKMVRALFAVARVHQPSVIFIDEIDSLLTQRSETEHESSRRIKTEFLVQLDGATTGDEDKILVIGATNRPHELDEAARRRFVKRLYVPLPELKARIQIVKNLLTSEKHELSDEDIEQIGIMSDSYSGADMANLCKEASMGPIRSISFEQLEKIQKEDVRCVTADDFHQALATVRPSVSSKDLDIYVQWDTVYGSGTAGKKT